MHSCWTLSKTWYMAGFTKEFMELYSHAWLILFKAAPLLFTLPKVQLFTVFQLTSASLLVFTECQNIQGGIVYSGLMHFNCTFLYTFTVWDATQKPKAQALQQKTVMCTSTVWFIYRPRFFVWIGHRTTNASIGSKYFFTK